jgi:type I restriction enzyme S subunit
MNWQPAKLGDLGEFRNGLNYSKENEGQGLKVISVKNFGTLRVPNYGSLDEINPDGVNTKDSRLEAGDIVFVRSNGNKELIGRSMFIEEDMPDVSFSGFCIRFRNHSEKVRSKFLAYYFRSPLFRRTLSNLGGGTNINNLNQTVLKGFEIAVPSPQEQDKIVSAISGYDDQIENNQRRIALLEAAARILYREWFVRLNFPGNEHAKVSDGVPKGWSLVTFADLAEYLNGFAFKPYHLGETGLPIVKIPELKGGTFPKTPRYDGLEVPDKYRLETGDLVFSWSGTLAVDFWTGGSAYLNQHLFKVTPTSTVSAAFLLVAIREAMPRFLNQTVGATMKHIRRSALSDVRLLMPSKDILDDFQDIIDANYLQVQTLRQANFRLAEARDLLLPRLMDGRIEI